MNVFMICDEFKKDTAGNIRQMRWIDRLLLHTNMVTVFAVESITNFNIYKVNQFNINSFNTHKKRKKSTRHGKGAEIARSLKYALFLHFFYPVYFSILIRLFFNIKKSDKKCYLFVSSPSFFLVLVSYILKKIFPSKVILSIDMRDPWATHWALPTWYVHRKIEKICLSSADYLSTVSFGLKKLFEENYSLECSLLYNDAKPLLISTQDRKVITDKYHKIFSILKNSEISLLYTGSTPEGFYDLDLISMTLINTLVQLSNINIIFIGPCENLERKIKANSKKNNLILSRIHFFHAVPNIVSRLAQKYSSALMFFAHNIENNGGYLTTKIFEYLSVKKPIITIGLLKNSDIYNLLEKNKHKPSLQLNVKFFIPNLQNLLSSVNNFQYTRKKTIKQYDNFIYKVFNSNISQGN